MNSPLGPTDRRRYSAVKLWLRGAINDDDDFHLLSLADVPFSSIQQLIAESGRVKQSFHKGHCKQCFESGFRASSKKPIRTHLKKYHAKDFKVAPAM
ncbi:unnamed protein product [Alternaria sp. RS040]